MRRALLVVLLLLTALPAAARAELAERPWPPRPDGPFVIHFGEEHWNDDDGKTIFPKVIEESVRYRPGMVTASGDKANDGLPEQLIPWRDYMSAFDRAGIPYFAAVGNHDRYSRGAPGGTTPTGDFSNYREVFKGRPYPMGDGPPVADPRFAPRERPQGDPEGAASHYHVDFAGSRWIFLDNSCFSITNCEELQNPPDGEGRTQSEYLEEHGMEATRAGKQVFIVAHMPTRDPGDQTYREATAVSHTQGKGVTTDNVLLEQAAARIGADGVFIAHIKGQFLYRGEGGVPYYIDGGAGGELYTEGPVGTDHGYWHGFRLIDVSGERPVTDAVPIFVPDSLRIDGPQRLLPGDRALFAGFGRQPVSVNDAKVEALELRDPDPTPRGAGGGGAAAVLWLLPFSTLALLLLARTARVVPRFRVPALAGVAVLGLGGVAVAQKSEPTSTPREALPNPARVWTTDNPRVLAPVASGHDDPRRDERTQTTDGRFAGRCPGRTRVRLTSGYETTTQVVTVRSREGRIARSVGRRRVVLDQAAVVRARVMRRGRTVATPLHDCRPAGTTTIRPPRARRGDRLEVVVFSDRKPVRRRFRLR